MDDNCLLVAGNDYSFELQSQDNCVPTFLRIQSRLGIKKQLNNWYKLGKTEQLLNQTLDITTWITSNM